MSVWIAQVRVWLKPSVFDPQGNAVEHALSSLGYEGVDHVRIGKYMELRIEAPSQADAEAKIEKMCESVLCNPVMETFAYTLTDATAKVSV